MRDAVQPRLADRMQVAQELACRIAPRKAEDMPHVHGGAGILQAALRGLEGVDDSVAAELA